MRPDLPGGATPAADPSRTRLYDRRTRGGEDPWRRRRHRRSHSGRTPRSPRRPTRSAIASSPARRRPSAR